MEEVIFWTLYVLLGAVAIVIITCIFRFLCRSLIFLDWLVLETDKYGNTYKDFKEQISEVYPLHYSQTQWHTYPVKYNIYYFFAQVPLINIFIFGCSLIVELIRLGIHLIVNLICSCCVAYSKNPQHIIWVILMFILNIFKHILRFVLGVLYSPVWIYKKLYGYWKKLLEKFYLIEF